MRARGARLTPKVAAVLADKRPPRRTQPMISCTIRTRGPALLVPLLAALAAVALAQQRVCPISDL
eukprot:COSAG06_NODE_3505_length_5258_cov_9.186858_1_plen_65_part_00